jgi:hypothetical protein
VQPRPRRTLVALSTCAFVLAGCDRGDTPSADDASTDSGTDAGDASSGGASSSDGAADAGDAGGDTGDAPGDTGDAGRDAAELPDVTTVDPDAADPDDGDGILTLDELIAASGADVPDDWATTVVPDPLYGPFLVSLPPAATVWRVGDDLEPLRDAAADTPWLRYWDPLLTEASGEVELASLRGAVVLPDVLDDTRVHLTVNLAQIEEGTPVDVEELVERFGEAQPAGYTINATGTEEVDEDAVGTVVLTTPDDEFDDGVPRRLQQWFYPEAGVGLLWGVTCEAPLPQAEPAAEVCTDILSSFRTSPR